jgi:CheY-like chemotaxis protein
VFTVFNQACSAETVRCKALNGHTAHRAQALRAGTRILVAEDNPENVILTQAFLQGFGLLLDFAANGVEAVEKRQRGDYDLILMDVQMPLMDGYEAASEIRRWEKIRRVPKIPILALTAHALNGAAEESLEAGCDGHLSKPYEREDLIAGIAKMLLDHGVIETIAC